MRDEVSRRFVCFFVGDRELAAPIDAVRETVDMRPITPVFRTPPSIAGLANLRGDILAVVDVAVMLGLPPSRRDPSTRIVVVKSQEMASSGQPRVAGLLVDRLGPIRDVFDAALEPPPPTLPPSVASMLAGVAPLPERPLAILDVTRLLGAPELAVFARAAREATAATEPMEGH